MDRWSEAGAIAGSKEPRTCRANVASPPRIAPPLLRGARAAAGALAALALGFASFLHAAETTVTQTAAGATWSLHGETSPVPGGTYTYTITRTVGTQPGNEYAGFHVPSTSTSVAHSNLGSNPMSCGTGKYFCASFSPSRSPGIWNNIQDHHTIYTEINNNTTITATLAVTADTPIGTTISFGAIENNGRARSGGMLLTVSSATPPVTNTAPTAADKTVTTGEDRAYAFTADDFGFDDAEEGIQPGHKVNGEAAATDRAALVALYNATSGPNWTINTNWLTTAALSEWYGVTTDVDGRVTHVFLGQNELNGELPVELGDLTNLQILYLNQNMLSGAIPVALGKLTNLEQLSLSQNMLSGEIPAALGDLTNLRQLYLNQNMLSGEIPAELGDLASLQILYLNQNGLSGAIPAELGDLASLQMLYLAQNELSGEIPAKLGDLTSLQILYLAQNELSGAIPAALGDLASLEQLDISQNGLSGAIPAELGDLSSLQILYLWGNELSGEIPAALGDLASLEQPGSRPE